jgi:RNA-directed DNA polymerase
VVSQRVFVRIDHEIHWALWRWAKRLHAHQSTSWIRRKYFQDRESHRNIFHTHITNREGEKVTVRIFQAASIPIRRHIKVRRDANPYDPAWEIYFEQRLYRKTLDELRNRSELRRQWRMQRGICPVCGELITQKTGWHNHHIQWRVHGGGDELENRVLLHPNCHQQVHSPEYNGPSLRPSGGVRDA